jgi:hypothetical protein
MDRHTAHRAALAFLLSLSLAGGAPGPMPVQAATEAAPPLKAPFQAPSAGGLVALAGTPHLWIADAQGVLHWAGDTRALAGKTVDWGSRREVTLDQLKGMQRGDPWLSAGLLKIGDPIYFVKWESDWAAPQLLHIQSIADVELFGINSANYGALVLDESVWQQQFKLAPGGLTKGVLAGATGSSPAPTPAAAAAPTPAAVTLVARKVQQTAYNNRTALHEVEVSGATPGTRLRVSGTFEQWECSPTCSSTKRGEFGPEDAGAVNAQGKLTWRRTHDWYSGARYTFTDPSGSKVTVQFSGDI